MIPFGRYLGELTAVSAAFSIRAVEPTADGEPVVDILEVVDRAAAITAIRAFHVARWKRPPGECGPAENRRQDLAELLGSIVLMFFGIQDERRVYPLALCSPGLTSDNSGIDVIGYHIGSNAGDLVPAERLGIAEAKTVEGTSFDNAVSSLQQDVKKATANRVGDTLTLLQWELENADDPNRFRLHLFLGSQSYWWGIILVDPTKVDLDKCIASCQNRLKNTSTPIHSPVTRVLVVSVEDTLDLVKATL